MYNDQLWIGHLQQVVAQHISVVTGDTTASVALIGHTKDETSYYLSMFPQWDPIEFTGIDDLHATDIRAHLFTQNISEFDKFVGHSLPVPIHDYLKAFTHTAHFDQLREEYAFIEQYKRSWLSAPYAPIFFTGDAVVIQSGHVLLVRRRSEPGKNLWAIPGGFLNYNERIDDVAIRELIEETKINCPAKVLYGSIAARHTFDHPDRSLRGRTITYASLIELPPGKLHKVKGGDDAEKARWVPLSTFQQMEDQMFEDHFQIINVFLGEV
jgi:bifunctional NMN adenylyltransferase/nudix hydrolase